MGEGEGEMVGESKGEIGEGGGRGAVSSCSISFSSLIKPGGSTLYLGGKMKSADLYDEFPGSCKAKWPVQHDSATTKHKTLYRQGK